MDASTRGTTMTVAQALFAPHSQLLNESQSHLCFNKAHFSRSDFNVERFVNLARRRANLQQIHNDLRVYLRVIQNSMIELINDDYADFVNLSSSLVGLKDSVDKLTKNVETVWSDFCSSTSEIMESAEQVEKETKHLISCRLSQLNIRAQISLIKSLDRLADKISKKPDQLDLFWLRGFVSAVVNVKLWSNQCTNIDKNVEKSLEICLEYVKRLTENWLINDLEKECRFVNVLLGIIALIGNFESAVNRVVNAISAKVNKKSDDLTVFMAELYGFIKSLRCSWINKLEANGLDVKGISPFLDECLLTHVLRTLDSHFTSVLVPSDSRLFRRCYTLTSDLLRDWPQNSSNCVDLKRKIIDRFSSIVYFKLETRHIFDELDSKLGDKVIRLLDNKDRLDSAVDGARLWFEYSHVVLNALEQIWSDTIYMPNIIDRLWGATLKIIGKYIEWLKNAKQHFQDDQNGSESADLWKICCAMCSDCSAVDAGIFSFALSTIWPKIRDLNLDVILFGQCISILSGEITNERKAFEAIFISNAISSLKKIMEGVSGIPRQYRWTKKPVPSAVSSYMNEALSLQQSFEKEMQGHEWSDDDCSNVMNEILQGTLDHFCSKASQVLESVEQTGTSLQRFKRKASVMESTSLDDTDEYKIKQQLLLDLQKCISLALQYNYSNIESINALIVRAQEVNH